MKRLMIGTALLAILAGPVYAQQKPVNAMNDEEKAKKSEADAVDRQYKALLEQTRRPATETRTDPWSNMRSASGTKAKN